MGDKSEIISRVVANTNRLIEKYNQLLVENQQLKETVDDHKRKIDFQKNNIENLERKIKNLEVSKLLNQPEVNERVKEKIDNMVREIDTCIELLNK